MRTVQVKESFVFRWNYWNKATRTKVNDCCSMPSYKTKIL